MIFPSGKSAADAGREPPESSRAGSREAFIADALAKNEAYRAYRWRRLKAVNRFLGLPAPVWRRRARDPRPEPGVIDNEAEEFE